MSENVSMDQRLFFSRDLLFILPASLGLGAALASLQGGTWLVGWLGFSFLFLLAFITLIVSIRWANGGRALAWMVALAFVLRLGGGITTYLALPIDGYQDDEDDRAGFVFTDAHRRDAQAWGLAKSEHPILDAFSKKFAYDQYGGLLAISAFVYRYLSPDAHRPLMLVLLTAAFAALGLSFLWKSVSLMWGEKNARVAGWIFALYPESVLLGGSAMREPYLMTLSAFAFWGFVDWQVNRSRRAWIWLTIGLIGMILISPVAALMSLLIFAGWIFFSNWETHISKWLIGVIVLAALISLFALSSALERQNASSAGTPVGVIGNFLRDAIQWDIKQLEIKSGKMQALFGRIPDWFHLPFVMIYGMFQPVLPAIFVEPTTPTWRIIGVARALGWYMALPLLVFSLVVALKQESVKERRLWLWLVFISWGWILLTSLRGGADQWDNPRYRAILFLWQAILMAYSLSWQRERRSPWLARIIAMEIVFLAFFSQWYVSRYLLIGGQLALSHMAAIIIGLWILITLGGWLWDRRRSSQQSISREKPAKEESGK